MKILVTDIATGNVVHRAWYQRIGHCWEPTQRVVAEWYECERDDVDLDDADGGNDTISVKGRVVAKVEMAFG